MRPYVIIVGCVCAWSSCPAEITHTTDDNDIHPHTIQKHNKRSSTKFNLVTAQSIAHEPPEDGRKYGPKHLGASFIKCFKY